MGVATKKTFYCDLCPAVFENGQALRDVVLPARLYDPSGEKYTKGFLKASLCSNCLDEFWKVSDSSFCMIESGMRGVKFYPHYETKPKNVPVPDPIIIGYQDKDLDPRKD